MKNGLILIILLITLMTIPTTNQAAMSETNTSFSKLAMSELLIGSGVRATAMGGAAVAFIDDLSSLYWNPAGLSQLNSLDFSLVHNTWIADIFQESLQFGVPIMKDSAISIGINYLGLGTIEQTEINSDGTIALTEKELNLFALGVQGGYGMHLLPNFAVGGSLKFNMQELGTQQNMAIALDLGGQYQLAKQWQLGLTVKNLGLGVQGFGLPIVSTFGVAYQSNLTEKQALLIGLDGEFPIQAMDQFLIHGGAEYRFNNIISVRVGYQFSDINDLGGLAGLTAGLGFDLAGWRLGYTFAPQGDLGTSHRLALGIDTAAIAQASRAAAKKKKKTRKRKVRKQAFGTRKAYDVRQSDHGPITIGSTGTTSKISQEEEMMRSIISKNLQVETKVNKVSKSGKVHTNIAFNVKRVSGPKVTAWTLTLRGQKDKLVRKLTGKNLPEKINWDGQDKTGKKVKGQSVTYKLTLVDINGDKESVNGRIVLSGKKAASPGGRSGNKNIKINLDPILFDKKRAEITPDGAEIITKAAQYIRQYPNVKVYIQGYADSVEERSQALVLSKSRAEAVARYLTAYHKVPMNRILVRGRGTKNPAVPNAKAKLRPQNRRVMISIKGKK